MPIADIVGIGVPPHPTANQVWGDGLLTLAFEVTPSPFGAVFAKVFEELAAAQMTAFIDRAKKIYGAPT